MSWTLTGESIHWASRPGLARGAVIAVLAIGAAAGWALGAAQPVHADAELVQLLRAMAVLKVAFVAAAAGSILWRLQAPVPMTWLAGYLGAAVAMAAGPVLIWFSSHIVLASVLLHAGLAASVLLLWRDGATAGLLRAAILRRRTRRTA